MRGHSSRGVTCVAHVFAGHVSADPGLVWTALTDPGQTAAYLYGLAAGGETDAAAGTAMATTAVVERR